MSNVQLRILLMLMAIYKFAPFGAQAEGEHPIRLAEASANVSQVSLPPTVIVNPGLHPAFSLQWPSILTPHISPSVRP